MNLKKKYFSIKFYFVATANLTTTFGTICIFSPTVKDEERTQRPGRARRNSSFLFQYSLTLYPTHYVSNFNFSLPYNLNVLQFSPCYPALPSPWSPSLSRCPPSTVMCPPVLHSLWFPFLSAIDCSYPSTNSHILMFVLPGGCCPPNLCGPASQETLAS